MLQCPKCGRQYASSEQVCAHDGTPLRADATLPATSNIDSFIGRVLDDKYRLDERLGEGGMGTVYRATHLLIERPVAVKVLNSRMVNDDAALERFRREARAAGRLRHTNAVAVTDFEDTTDRSVYIVMELLEGATLREVIAREAPLDAARAVSFMLQASAAVAAAHEAGIIHRDLKPGNIFIVQRPHAPHILKVLDFGIAKLASDATDGGSNPVTLTGTGVMIGTPRYMSPEQCDGATLTPASDVYSLGVILYELLTGQPPFGGATPLSVALKHSSELPRPPREIVAAIPPALEEVVLHALEKKPEARPSDAGAFRRELYTVAERLGLEHAAAGFSAPTIETLRDAGTETPSGRLVIDIERLRQTRATNAPDATGQVFAPPTSELPVVQTGDKSPSGGASVSQHAPAPRLDSSPSDSSSVDSSADASSPASSLDGSPSAVSTSDNPASQASSARAASPISSAASVAPLPSYAAPQTLSDSVSVPASASASSGKARAEASRVRVPVAGEGSSWREHLRGTPLFIVVSALIAVALVVALVAWRSSRPANDARATATAFDAEESVGRTLAAADIAPRRASPASEPRSAAEFYERGAYYFSSRDYDAAINDYRQAIKLQPDFPNAHNRLGRALMLKGQFGAAAREFQEAIRQKQGVYPAASYNLGFALQQQGNTEDAIRTYTDAINSRDGNYADAYYQIGIIHLGRGRDAEAAQALRRAVEQNKGRDADAHAALGVALARQQDYAGAETALRAAIDERGGDFAEAHFNLGLVYEKTNRIENAIREFESYLRQQPTGANRRLAENSIRDLRRRAAREGSQQP